MLSAKSLLSGRDSRKETDWGVVTEETSSSQASTPPQRQITSSKASILKEDCTIRGAFECGGDLEVDGFLEGDLLVGGKLTITESGLVRANCRANTAVIAGKVVGDILCAEKIELLSGAEIRGNLKTKRLTIEDGVIFDGRVEMPIPEANSKEDLLDLQMDAILGHEGAQ